MTDPSTTGKADVILLGVDASTGSAAALGFAVQEAQRRGGRVRAMMAWRPSGLPGAAPGRPPAQSIVDVDLEQVARETLEEVVAAVLGDDHDVECVVAEGRPETVLVRAAEDAVLLVLDSPRPSKLTAARARRTASKLIFASPCPVVVMPVPAETSDPDVEQAREQTGDDAVEAAQTATGPAGPITT